MYAFIKVQAMDNEVTFLKLFTKNPSADELHTAIKAHYAEEEFYNCNLQIITESINYALDNLDENGFDFTDNLSNPFELFLVILN